MKALKMHVAETIGASRFGQRWYGEAQRELLDDELVSDSEVQFLGRRICLVFFCLLIFLGVDTSRKKILKQSMFCFFCLAGGYCLRGPKVGEYFDIDRLFA